MAQTKQKKRRKTKRKKQNTKNVVILLAVTLSTLVLGLFLLFRVLLPGPNFLHTLPSDSAENPASDTEQASHPVSDPESEPGQEEEESDSPQPVPIGPMPSLPLSDLQTDHFVPYYGFILYEDPDFTTAAGIDVSSHQGYIDWQAVKDFGINYAIIRAGFRGYSEGDLNQDDYFQHNIDSATAAGLDVGVYFFSQALTPEEAREEAEMVLELVEGYDLQYPIYYDWEPIDYADARTDTISATEITACAEAFCSTIEEAGYDAGLYFNLTNAYYRFFLFDLQEYDFWLAEYRESPTYPYAIDMWQYTDSGQVPGIDANVDLNISFVPNT